MWNMIKSSNMSVFTLCGPILSLLSKSLTITLSAGASPLCTLLFYFPVETWNYKYASVREWCSELLRTSAQLGPGTWYWYWYWVLVPGTWYWDWVLVPGTGSWYLVGLVGVCHDLGGVADEEHEHDGAQQRRHRGVPPVPRGDRVVELAVSGEGEKRCVRISAVDDPSVFTIMEKAPASAFSWLKAATTAFTLRTLLGTFSVIVQLRRLIVYSISKTRYWFPRHMSPLDAGVDDVIEEGEKKNRNKAHHDAVP